MTATAWATSGLSHLEVAAATDSHEEHKDDSATKGTKITKGVTLTGPPCGRQTAAYFLVSLVSLVANRCDRRFGYAI
jgi:hypothetical protein